MYIYFVLQKKMIDMIDMAAPSTTLGHDDVMAMSPEDFTLLSWTSHEIWLGYDN